MSEFFQHYPQIDYNITGTAPPKFRTAINIMTRAKLRNVIMNDVVQYFPYSIPEAERPDITSFKTYGDVKFTWLIFLINESNELVALSLVRFFITCSVPDFAICSHFGSSKVSKYSSNFFA